MINPEDGPMTVPGCKSNLVRENQADVVSRLKQQVEIRGTASPFGMLAADALKFIQQQAEQIAELKRDAERYRWLRNNWHGFQYYKAMDHISLDYDIDRQIAALAKPMPKAMKEDS
jgi:hypothetical protein